MEKISRFILCLICILGIATRVDAASYSSSISATKSGTKYEYVSGLPIYYNKSGSYSLYVLDNDTYFNATTTLRDPELTDSGFTYIINNSDVTSSSYKNYYIAQAAILWYQDYLNGDDANISASMKQAISNNTNDTVCYNISKLVNNAKKYSQNGGSIEFLDNDITFSKSGSYYYSNVIDVETNNLNSTPSVKLYNAPKNATIVENTVSKDGEGSFQIRIPSSSMSDFDETDFEVYITGKGYTYTTYKYSDYGMDDAIYGRVYSSSSSNIEASIPVKTNGLSNTNVRIRVVDNDGDYISGINYKIYSGNCYSSTCYSDDYVETYTAKTGYTTLSGYDSGLYTLVLSSNTKYNLPEKIVIDLENVNSVQEFTIEEYEDNYYDDNNGNQFNDYNDNYKRVLIYNDLNDSTNIIKIYSVGGILLNSYRSNNTSYEYALPAGSYYLADSKGLLDKVYFKIENGLLKVRDNGQYITAGYINLTDTLEDFPYVENDDYKNNIYKDENGNIKIENLDGISSVDISTEVETNTDVKVNWLSSIIDCPKTSVSSTLKYVTGAIILSIGAYLVVRNVKKSKNNI